MAKLYKSATGIVGFPRTDYINAAVAIENDGIIIAIGTTDADCWRYENGAWALANANITGAGGTPACLYLDSRGYLYTGFNDGDIWRSINNGTTWASVNSSVATDGYPTPFAENETGDMVVGNYNQAGGSAELFRSTDGGATWINITANLAGGYGRHIHNCYYDHYRGALLVNGGDDGVSDEIEISFDFGDTFTILTDTVQATGMITDANNFYYIADTSTDRQIYKMAIGPDATTPAQWNAVTPQAVFNPLSDPDITLNNLFTWQMFDFDGVLVTSFGKGTQAAIMVASEDEGATWQTLDKILGSDQRIAFEAVNPSFYASNWGGLLYNTDSDGRYLYQWTVYSDSIGVDFQGPTDNARLPLHRIPEDISTAGSTFRLRSNYTDNLIIGAPNITIIPKNYQLGTPQTGPLIVDEGFEGASSLTQSASAGVVVDQTDTSNPFEGLRDALIDMSGGSGTASGQVEFIGVGATTGQEVWASGWFYIDSPVWDANSALRTLYMQDNAFVSVAAIGIASNQEWTLVYRADGTTRTANQRIGNPIIAELETYQQLKLGIYIDATQGWIRAYVDELLIFEITGIQTLYDTGINDIRWGIQSQNYYRYFYDNCRAAVDVDCDLPGAVTGNPIIVENEMGYVGLDPSLIVAGGFVTVTNTQGRSSDVNIAYTAQGTETVERMGARFELGAGGVTRELQIGLYEFDGSIPTTLIPSSVVNLPGPPVGAPENVEVDLPVPYELIQGRQYVICAVTDAGSTGFLLNIIDSTNAVGQMSSTANTQAGVLVDPWPHNSYATPGNASFWAEFSVSDTSSSNRRNYRNSMPLGGRAGPSAKHQSPLVRTRR